MHYDISRGFDNRGSTPANAYDSVLIMAASVFVRTGYGQHNRGTKLRVHGCLELGVIEFTAADAHVTVALSGERLVTFTNALARFLTPEQRAAIASAGGAE